MVELNETKVSQNIKYTHHDWTKENINQPHTFIQEVVNTRKRIDIHQQPERGITTPIDNNNKLYTYNQRKSNNTDIKQKPKTSNKL